MAAFTSGSNWSFPDDLSGGWVKVEEHEEVHMPTPADTEEEEADSESQPRPTSEQQEQRQRRYPPRQCRICLEVVQPTFHQSEPSALPSALHSRPRVTFESPSGDGGRLLRPCKCKGSQQYVHEDCLSAWRMQDPLRKRNYWQCPTCGYKYRLQRLTWGSWITSTAAQIGLTVVIFITAMFVLGFVADPIINLYLDPVDTIATRGGPTGSLLFDDEPATWVEHFVKGLASLGLLGFAKFLFTLSPFNWFNMRGTGIYVGGGGRRGVGVTGQDRLAQISWFTVVIGIATFLYAVWKGVRAWSRRTLEKAGERVMDVPESSEDLDIDGDDDMTPDQTSDPQ